ncbi:MAG: arginine--tRNA ligase [Anaerohalosphaeraceae bacterium]
MKNLLTILEGRISEALRQASGLNEAAALVSPSKNPAFGDYQANGVMAAAKQLKTNPRQLAEQVVRLLQIDDLCETVEIAGPGFINLRLKSSLLEQRLLGMFADPVRLGMEPAEKPQTIVVDYSGPNIAKEMHVGHLRSTIIGDWIARVHDFEGHHVIRQNHIGDWGTQFGKVILALWHICMGEKVHKKEYYVEELKELKENKDNPYTLLSICTRIRDRHNADYENDQTEEYGNGEKVFGPFLSELPNRNKNEIWPKLLYAYQYVNFLDDVLEKMNLTIYTREIINNKAQKKEIPYQDLTRYVTVMLQRSNEMTDKQEYDAWKFVTKTTLRHCNEIYQQLNITLKDDDVRGESFYASMLPEVVRELRQKGLAVESEGAVCVFPKGFVGKDGSPLPFIIQKSDGAYLYATTDLAALRFRIQQLGADKIVYVTDARQTLHFQMLFETARAAGWTDSRVELVHVTFGTMLGPDGRPFKTREGGTVKLKDLLEEAVEKARAVVEEKNPSLPAEQKAAIARAVGIGAVKYADYANNRDTDYVFSFDKMLAMDGNTAPYMQYAYARIRSIERKAAGKEVDVERELAGIERVVLSDAAEIELAKKLISYEQAIESAAASYRPNLLTAYLYDLSQSFSRFYNACPVLGAPADVRPSRLLLCELTARVIRHGMQDLLGIETPEQM